MKLRGKRIFAVLVGSGSFLVGYNEIQTKKYPQFNKEEIRDVISQEPYRVQVFMHLPLNGLSRLWGRMSQIRLPEWSRPYLLGLYVKTYNCNMEDAEVGDLKSYTTFGNFFRRSIKQERRPISESSSLVSPCDGVILSAGVITQEKVEHVKGKTYSLNYFLGPNDWKSGVVKLFANFKTQKNTVEKRLVEKSDKSEDVSKASNTNYCETLKVNPKNCLYHCTIYLAPGDYHRFHSPASWLCTFRRYFPGYLLSVSPKMATRFPELLNVNERVVYIGSWEHGFFSFAAVGATNVGSIKIYKDPLLVTNQRSKLPPMIDFGFEPSNDADLSSIVTTSIRYQKGEGFGEFNLGSTVVLIFEAPENFKFHAIPGEKIKYGEALGS